MKDFASKGNTIYKSDSPKVKSDVTPKPTLAVTSRGFIQNVTQDKTTMRDDGKYV